MIPDVIGPVVAGQVAFVHGTRLGG
jgi:hypothetical protein